MWFSLECYVATNWVWDTGPKTIFRQKIYIFSTPRYVRSKYVPLSHIFGLFFIIPFFFNIFSVHYLSSFFPHPQSLFLSLSFHIAANFTCFFPRVLNLLYTRVFCFILLTCCYFATVLPSVLTSKPFICLKCIFTIRNCANTVL